MHPRLPFSLDFFHRPEPFGVRACAAGFVPLRTEAVC